jgi:predicted MFS family arabinose efflux permease
MHPLVGWFYQKYSIDSGLFIALCLTVLSTSSYGWAHHFYTLLIMRCLWGTAWSLLKQGSQLIVIEAGAQHQSIGTYTGIFNGISRLGSLVGMIAGGLCVEWVGLQVPVYIFAGLAMVSVPLILLFKEKDKRSVTLESSSTSFTIMSLLTDKSFLRIVLLSITLAIVFQGFLKSILSYWIDHQDLSNVLWLGAIGSAAWTGILQGLRWAWEPIISPWIGKNMDKRQFRGKILIITMPASGVLFILLPQSISPYLWLLVILLIMLTATILSTAMDALAMERASYNSKQLTLTVYAISQDIGAAAGPLIGYSVFIYVGDSIICWVISLILLTAALIWKRTERSGRYVKTDMNYGQ